MERMRRLRVSLAPHDSAERFRELGVDVFFGAGRFKNSETIEVGGQSLRFRRALIATGAHAAIPDIPGLVDTGFLTNETAFSLTSLPRRLVVLGAGPVGCELAQAWARLGSQVTLIASHANVLPKEDVDAARVVEKSLCRDGVEILKQARVVAVERRGEEKLLRIEANAEKLESKERIADQVLVAVGRKPNVDGLGFESAGIEFDVRAGVRVDDRLRTTNRRVFAAGDVCSRFQFTHAADAMARIVLQNALFPDEAACRRWSSRAALTPIRKSLSWG